MIFSDRLASLLKAKKTDWAKVSKELDIGKNQQKYWETHDSTPDGKTLIKLAQYFGVTSDYLLGIDGFEIDEIKLPDEFELSEEEKLLLTTFRTVDMEGKFRIIQVCMNERDEERKRKMAMASAE